MSPAEFADRYAIYFRNFETPLVPNNTWPRYTVTHGMQRLASNGVTLYPYPCEFESHEEVPKVSVPLGGPTTYVTFSQAETLPNAAPTIVAVECRNSLYDTVDRWGAR
jgi:hypothetical protein